MRSLHAVTSSSLLPLLAVLGCSGTPTAVSTTDMATATKAGSPVASVTLSETVESPALTGSVDLVRDEYGVPHIYGANIADVSFVQGYVMAEDRLVQMDLIRHKADGSVCELVGELYPSVIDDDIRQRAWGLRKTAEGEWAQISGSTDPQDQVIAKSLTAFAAGVNAFIADLTQGNHGFTLPGALAFVYNPKTANPWTEVDSLLLGDFELFDNSFDADSDIANTQLLASAASTFSATDPNPAIALRAGIGADLSILMPIDHTYTINGWPGMNGDTSTASLMPERAPGKLQSVTPAAASAPSPTGLTDSDGNLLALLEDGRANTFGAGVDRRVHPSRGSNNWVVGPSLSQSGHAMLANDTHLGLSNPSIWYQVHLKVSGDTPLDVMGVQLPGAPAVAIGMNEHVAWGVTDSYVDDTDVYQETVVTCDDGKTPCVMWKGAKVALVPRVETFGVGKYGVISQTLSETFYDVPHHGPIIPRVGAAHQVAALGSSELSVRHNGFEPAQVFRGVSGINQARSMTEVLSHIDGEWTYGSFNFVVVDDQGNFGWTEATRLSRRAAGHPANQVLPGDGSAEWGDQLDAHYIPHAYNVAAGFLATANNDPVGVTDDGDPFDEPLVDGVPLYVGWDYDPGARVGRITKRLQAGSGGGKKLSLDDMQSIQADAITEWGQQLTPTLVDAAQALADEIATPGTHPDLTALAQGVSPADKAMLPTVLGWMKGWTFDMPSAVAEDAPSAQQIADSQASLVFAAFAGNLATRALGDEIALLDSGPSDDRQARLVLRMCTHPELLESGIGANGDPNLFDDLRTPLVVEDKRYIVAAALLDTLDGLAKNPALGSDPGKWRWGAVHTLTLEFFAPIDALAIPPSTDPAYPHGFPRHGGNGAVDAADTGLSTSDFSYGAGPAIRFVVEMDPVNGPHGRNVIPGGEVFDPASPHYRDQIELWRKNQAPDMRYTDADVVASAMKEVQANSIGRWHFAPPATN